MPQQQVMPYNRAELITKSDSINQDGTTAANLTGTINRAKPFEAIFVGGTGIVVVVMEDYTTQAFTCAVGEILPVKGIRVNASTTSATLMEALYTV